MKEKIRTLDFYGFDDGCITENKSKFVKNPKNDKVIVSKTPEYIVVNLFGK